MQRRQHRRAPGPKGHRRVMADLAMGLRSIIRAPSVLPRSGRSRATVTSRSPDLIMSRRGVASHRGPGGQHTNAEFIAEQHRPGAPANLAAPSASRPPVFCSEMTFLRQLRIHPKALLGYPSEETPMPGDDPIFTNCPGMDRDFIPPDSRRPCRHNARVRT
jgi:hypothetical protein